MTVLAAHAWASNAELIEAVHQLGFIADDDLVYDATYEKGIWWKVFRPARLITANLGEAGSAVADLHADFRRAPFADGTFDVVAYDPPYVCIGGRKTTTMPQFHQRYGTLTTPKTPADLQTLIDRGLHEMLRIVKPGGIVLVKCQDYISSGKLWIGTHHTLTWALDIGFTLEDRLEHISGTRAQPKNRTRKCAPCKGTGVLAVVGDDELPCSDCEGLGRLASEQQHARRNLSTLFVLRAPRRKP